MVAACEGHMLPTGSPARVARMQVVSRSEGHDQRSTERAPGSWRVPAGALERAASAALGAQGALPSGSTQGRLPTPLRWQAHRPLPACWRQQPADCAQRAGGRCGDRARAGAGQGLCAQHGPVAGAPVGGAALLEGCRFAGAAQRYAAPAPRQDAPAVHRAPWRAASWDWWLCCIGISCTSALSWWTRCACLCCTAGHAQACTQAWGGRLRHHCGCSSWPSTPTMTPAASRCSSPLSA